MSTTNYSPRPSTLPPQPGFLNMLWSRWKQFTPRALDDIPHYFTQQPAFNFNDFFQGLKSAANGFLSAWNNPKIKDTYWSLIRSLGAAMILLYAITFMGIFTFLPIFLFFPSWPVQLLSLVPFWSYNIAKRRNPLSSTRLFLDELYVINPSLADEIAAQLPSSQKQGFNGEWVRSVYNDTRSSWHFVKLSLFFMALSFIPLVGSLLSLVGTYYLIADKLGWEMLSVYTQSLKRMDYKETKDWMRNRKWAIIGFALPFAVLSTIPFGGPLLLGYAQAASAHLFNQLPLAQGKSTAQRIMTQQG